MSSMQQRTKPSNTQETDLQVKKACRTTLDQLLNKPQENRLAFVVLAVSPLKFSWNASPAWNEACYCCLFLSVFVFDFTDYTRGHNCSISLGRVRVTCWELTANVSRLLVNMNNAWLLITPAAQPTAQEIQHFCTTCIHSLTVWFCAEEKKCFLWDDDWCWTWGFWSCDIWLHPFRLLNKPLSVCEHQHGLFFTFSLWWLYPELSTQPAEPSVCPAYLYLF